MIGQKVDGVAVVNAVTEGLADLAKMMKNWKDIGLHTDGTGNIGTVSSVANKTYTLTPTPFGTRNIEIGQTVDIVNPAGNVTRGSVTVSNKTAFLGAVQTFTYTNADVPGAALIYRKNKNRFHGPIRGSERACSFQRPLRKSSIPVERMRVVQEYRV